MTPTLISSVVAANGLPREWTHRLASTPDGVALATNLANWSAKTLCPSFYGHKEMLIAWLVEYHPLVWQDRGVVYVETTFGQVSFHVFKDEDKLAPPAYGRAWTGEDTQQNAVALVAAFCTDNDEPHA